tara:strand:- start:11021 stop:12343 length:1323 start_codon:yes stop_codon:yes gene_type:complete
MKKSTQLKQKRAGIIRKWDAIVKLAETENRELTADENAEITAFRAECDAADSQIENAESLEQRLLNEANAGRELNAGGAGVGDGGEGKEKDKVYKSFSISKMFRNGVSGSPLDGAEKEVQEIAEAENRAANVKADEMIKGTRLMIPLSYLRATQQTVTQDSGEYGGQLVQNQAPRVIAGLQPKLMLETLGATLLTNLSGGSVPLPVMNSYSMEWLAEGASITSQKEKLVGPALTAKRAGAAVSLSNRLIMQSSPKVDEMVRSMMSRGWENAINGAAINGAGGVAPLGILNTPGVGSAADAAAVAANYAKMVELQGLIEENDSTETSLAYLLNPKLKAALKTKSKDAGSGRFIIEGNELDGYRFVSTSLVAAGDDAGTAVYPLIFGDFSQLFIGQWGAVSFTINPYSEDLADSTRIVLNTHSDVQIANPGAFAVNTFLTNG